MIKLLFRTDVHVSDHTPISRRDQWADTVCDKLEQFGQLLRENGCDAAFDNGDFFNDKTPIRTSHEIVTRVARIHQGYPCPTYANVGNHDCRHANILFLDESPLGSLFETGIFRRCFNEDEAVFMKDGVSVRVVGIPYHGRSYDLERFKIKKGDEDYLVVMAHVLASPTQTTMFDQEDVIRYDVLPTLAPDVDVWYFGHWHKDQGVERVGKSLVVNTGSFTRGSLVEDNIERVPKAILMEFGAEARVVEIPLNVAPAEEVFDLERKVREEIQGLSMTLFTESLKSALTESSGESLEKQISDAKGVMPRVKDKAREYLDRARHLPK